MKINQNRLSILYDCFTYCRTAYIPRRSRYTSFNSLRLLQTQTQTLTPEDINFQFFTIASHGAASPRDPQEHPVFQFFTIASGEHSLRIPVYISDAFNSLRLLQLKACSSRSSTRISRCPPFNSLRLLLCSSSVKAR